MLLRGGGELMETLQVAEVFTAPANEKRYHIFSGAAGGNSVGGMRTGRKSLFIEIYKPIKI